MAKTLTETSVHTAIVQVPLPGEKVTGASVEAPFQALTNRTRYAFDRLRAKAVQNWELCGASVANLNADPVLIYVPTSADDDDGYWVAVAGHASNIAAVGLSEDECGMQDIAIAASWPVGVTIITWAAVAPWDASLTCAPFIVGGAQDDIAVQRGELPGSGAFTTVAITGATLTSCGAWLPAAAKFLVGGAVTGEPNLWLVDTTAPPTFASPELTFDVSTAVVDVAVDVANDIAVAIGNSPGGSTSDTWIVTNAGVDVALNTVAIDDMQAIAYSPSLDLWMLVANGGDVHKSTNGTTWAPVATAIPALASCLRLIEQDGVWVASCEGALAFSQDSGATWHRAWVNGAPSTASPNVLTGLPISAAYSVARVRFGSVHKNAANELVFNRSLTIGIMPEHS
jgi:hypothetical protein